MFRHVAGFELRYQLTSPVFWGTSIIFFLAALATVASDELRIGWGGQVFRNSPYAITMVCMVWSIFATFIVTAFVSNVVLRDDETGFGPIIQATPLSKFNYLFGRFSGGLLTASLAFLSVPLGAMTAVFLPGVDPATIGPVRIGDYLYVYLFICVPTLLVLGAALFALATATRSMLATYVGALVILALYLFTSVYLSRPELGAGATLLDPFGLAVVEFDTRYWTAHDRNTQLPPLVGLMLMNRALWGVVAFTLLALAWRSFARKGPSSTSGRAASEAKELKSTDAPAARSPAPPTNRALGWRPLATLSHFEIMGVLRSAVFILLLGYAFISTIAGLWLAGDDNVTVVYPVTRVMIQTLMVHFMTIPLFIAAFYAGELVWRDRERRVHEIVDATPSSDWAFLVPKILAIASILLAMGLMSIVAAVSVQLLKGFTDIDFGHYFTWYLAPWFLTMMLYAVLAVFVQSLVPHKFVGLLVILLYFVLQEALPTMGFENHLYLYATTTPVPLSDMNGLGKFAGYAAWYRAYWTACAVILVMLTYALWQRGMSTALRLRIKMLPKRLAGSAGVIVGTAAVVMTSLGAYIYYNTSVLNEYQTYVASQRWAANYEKALLSYDNDPLPRITDVTLNVDLYPHTPRAVIRGEYIIENKTDAALQQVYVSWPKANVKKLFLGTIATPDLEMVSLEVPGAKMTREYPEFHFRIYTFDKPMAPGERREIRFEAVREQRGFRNAHNEDRIVENGTFLDNFSITPTLGISRWTLLEDRATRRKYGLDPDFTPTKLEDDEGRAFHYFRHDSDFVNSDITVSGPADQTLLAPGRQVSRKVVDGRQWVRFRSEAPIHNFFSIQAARYSVLKEQWKDITLEVYYHPQHAYNIERFIDIAKYSFEYYSTNFSPYQFNQFRIVEFPAYNNWAQAFPGTVAYSEAAGFIANIDDSEGVDFVAYVTAHEIGHQWWAHQVVGADMQGSTVLSETLAEYSALMVMENRYGATMIRRFLKRSLNGYLGARGRENVAEPPLERVEGQAYVRYQKGGMVMYLLKERMGEEAVNRALRSLIDEYAFKGPPYPTSRDLIERLRAEAKPEHQQLITDLFQKITLYDLKVNDARANLRPDGKWTVVFTVEAHKRYADGRGLEEEAPLDEVFDVGVFTADPMANDFSEANVLSMQSQRLRTGRHELVVVVDQEPKYVGIDPYVKYIDRNSDNNVRKVE